MSQEFAGAELKLGQANALVKILGGMEVVMSILQGSAKVVIEKVVVEVVRLLTKINTEPVIVPGVDKFVATKEVFRDEANVGYFWSDFVNNFFGKVEEGGKETALVLYRLEKNSVDKPIMDELSEKAETSLWQFFWLLKQQSKGQDGKLLTNGYANIFYIRDAKGKLWAVHASWSSDDGYWHVYASSVAVSHPWYADDQVFSRD